VTGWVRSSHCQNGECVEVAWRKASASTYNGQCVEVGWQKASVSGPNGSCVEAGTGSCGMIHVRDSKDKAGPQLRFTPAAWRAFLDGIRTGEFDG
jgi:Domain of unknown function (DUF397)